MLNGLVLRDEIECPTAEETLTHSGQLDTFVRDQLPGILDRAYHDGTQIFVVDGRPGIGKTTMAKYILAHFKQHGINVEMVSTDDDVKPRDERAGLSIIDYHPGRIVKRAVRRRLYDSVDPVEFDELTYRTASGKIDAPRHYKIPGKGGILVIEGFRSIEYALKLGGCDGGDLQKVLPIYLDAPSYVVNGRRFARDVMKKGLGVDEVQGRIDSQESVLAAYGNDMLHDLMMITGVIKRDITRVLFSN